MRELTAVEYEHLRADVHAVAERYATPLADDQAGESGLAQAVVRLHVAIAILTVVADDIESVLREVWIPVRPLTARQPPQRRHGGL